MLPTREPNESHEQFLLRISIPTVAQRVETATLAIALIMAATHHPNDEVDCDLWKAIHRAAVDANEELYSLSTLPAKTLATIAPNGDQQTDLDLAGVEPDPRD